MTSLNYEKRKNNEFFKTLQELEDIKLSKVQNYLPIYNKLFRLNETNFNSINLNNKWYIHDIKGKKNEDVKDNKKDDNKKNDTEDEIEENYNIFNCVIKNIDSPEKEIERNVFFKFAPLLDPFKFLIGKYNVADKSLFNIPDLNSDEKTVNPKLLDENNSAYVDGMFSYLTSQLIHENNFIHGIDFYGSFMAIKNKFVFNVADDLDYLCKSDFFNKNKNVTFEIEDYSYLLENNRGDSKPGLKPIVIDRTKTNKSLISIHSIEGELYDDIFSNDTNNDTNNNTNNNDDGIKEDKLENWMDMIHVKKEDKTTTLKSSSTCSSRTSHTSNSIHSSLNDDNSESGSGSEDEEVSFDETDSMSDDEDEPIIDATIPNFPVNMICMENCHSTLDELIVDNDLSDDEWFSALMQIIMILITYQKCFSFTHNDLHTNNVMYNKTEKKNIYYCYKKKYYKVPTFGRIFKIIDFGRAIYKYNNQLFCSDAFQHGEDASTQYNTEPYFNEKKPRLDPNFSFDLCRLGCSLFDYLIEETDDISDTKKCSPLVRLIVEWCKDDAGLNILYKTNGAERYPDFKLYKMIARCVHNHTPQAQLDRTEFAAYLIPRKEITKRAVIMNIDNIPIMTNSIVKLD